MLVEPNIIAAVEQLFEAPARVYYGMTAVVPANGGNGLPWHQDNQYSQILPLLLTSSLRSVTSRQIKRFCGSLRKHTRQEHSPPNKPRD
jgi:hypothetical protein